MSTNLFIDPLDVLFMRGNKLFGDAGSYGESLVPPWPSVAAGAIRSALLVHRGYNLRRYSSGEVMQDPELGTPSQPGTFVLERFHLAQRFEDGRIETIHALPADLSVYASEDPNRVEVRRIRPTPMNPALASSSPTSLLPVLPTSTRSKPQGGYWLSQSQWHNHLLGEHIEPDGLLRSSDLWHAEERIGIALDADKRRARDGQLFTAQAVTLRKAEHGSQHQYSADAVSTVGFLAGMSGVTLPKKLVLRFGGDGRAALARVETSVEQVGCDFRSLAQAGRCRMILTSPGVFADGWMPTGTAGDGRELRFHLGGVRARLTCAAVPRAEVVSGFDLATRRPKPANRVAPVGSVYWLDDLDATPDALEKLVERGLWPDSVENTARRAEGFNRFTFAAY